MKKVAVLLVLFNSEKYLPRLLSSIQKQTYEQLEIYILDNNSVDNSVSLCNTYYSSAKITVMQENTGYAKGNNILAAQAVSDDMDYLFILNADLELDEHCVEKLVDVYSEYDNVGVVSPIIFYSNKGKKTTKIQHFDHMADYKKRRMNSIYNNQIFGETLPDTMKVNYVNGNAFMLSNKLYQKVGLFDESYFMYGEEYDFGLRVNNTKYSMYSASNAKIWNFHDFNNESNERKSFKYYYIKRNKYLYFRKHRFYYNMFVNLLKELFYLPYKCYWLIKTGGTITLRYYYLGVYDGLLGKKGKVNYPFFKGSSI